MTKGFFPSLYLSLILLTLLKIGDVEKIPAQTTTQDKGSSPVDVLELRTKGTYQSQPSGGAAPLPTSSEEAAFLRTEDGRIVMFGGGKICASSDGGQTWSRPLRMSKPVISVIRLNSGKLGGFVPDDLLNSPSAESKASLTRIGYSKLVFFVSADRGQTWEERGSVGSWDPNIAAHFALENTLIQTKSGQLVLPVVYLTGNGHEGFRDETMSWGLLQGKLHPVESHAGVPEFQMSFTFNSHDEGRTWQRSEGVVMVWKDEGYGGMWPGDEPVVVEAKNGDILMFLRSFLGRVYSARSRPVDLIDRAGKRVERPVGVRFDHPESTILATSNSPCSVTRISKTGDLLIVWNQVSGDEVRAGYRRSRLSSAISKDDGKSWQHFRTIDRCVLPPTGYVKPEPERLIRALDYVGVLPDDFGSISYPSIHVVGETVFVTASRSQHDPSSKKWSSGRVMYRLPLDWFYQEEPALSQGPKLLLRVPATDLDGEWVAHQIPADHYQGRFLCNSRDLAKILKSPVGRLNLNLYGPVEQLITCLGWTATYDRDHLKDPQNPRMIVTAQLPGMQRKP